ncbi:hypothetical protein FRAHR75_130041 [Frankia sp. Hr75.2]|nr:hypothetical protein FRAHR75_130041 [Frankia sp. Hr75.2]
MGAATPAQVALYGDHLAAMEQAGATGCCPVVRCVTGYVGTVSARQSDHRVGVGDAF